MDLQSSNPSNSSRGLSRSARNNVVKKETTFVDDDDAIFSAIDTEGIKEELHDGDDDIFQTIQTNDSKPPLVTASELRLVQKSLAIEGSW